MLKGSNRDVICTNCGYTEPRPNYQDRISDLNLEWIKNYLPHVVNKDQIRADGDAHLGNVTFDDFQIPGCQRCIEGIMKPNVVFLVVTCKAMSEETAWKKWKQPINY